MNHKSLQNLKRGGSPGRQKGVQNKATVEVKEAARAFLSDPVGQAKLAEQYRRGKLHPSVLQMFYHYAFGKPAETVNLNAGDVMPWVVVLPAGADPVDDQR
jgi:hypothetical protein